MSDFTINISKLNKNIYDYRTNKSVLLNEINNSYNSLQNVDAAWNDDNSIVFIDSLKSDKFKINNYFSELDKLYLEIENFKDGLNYICNKYECKSNSLLKYNDSKINVLINKLNNINNYISNALYYVNLCDMSNFTQRSKIRQLKNSLKEMKSDINLIINNFKSFQRDMNNMLIDSKHTFAKMKDLEVNIKPLEYTWNLTTPQLKKVVLEENVKYNISTQNISDVKNEGVSYHFNEVSQTNNGIDFDSNNDINLETNSLLSNNANINSVKMQDTDMDNIIYTEKSDRNINLENNIDNYILESDNKE